MRSATGKERPPKAKADPCPKVRLQRGSALDSSCFCSFCFVGVNRVVVVVAGAAAVAVAAIFVTVVGFWSCLLCVCDRVCV